MHINVGGGLGVNYEHPNHFLCLICRVYFKIFREHLTPVPVRHCIRTRTCSGSTVWQSYSESAGKSRYFEEICHSDAGFTELIRPALYQAYHRIENLSSDKAEETYDVVGPIYESSDTFAKDYVMNATKRGD